LTPFDFSLVVARKVQRKQDSAAFLVSRETSYESYAA